MFREMRRKRQELSREETAAILHRGTNGVLAGAGFRFLKEDNRHDHSFFLFKMNLQITFKL